MQALLGFAAALVILTALLWLLVPAWYGLPPISAGKDRICKALDLAHPAPGETFYDLGCGHGRALVIAAREYGLRAVGVEAGPVQRAVSRLNAFWNGVSSQVRIEAGDFFKTELRKADIVYAYLTPSHGRRLGEKLARELKPGARVVTVAFDLPGWQPARFDRGSLIYVYEI